MRQSFFEITENKKIAKDTFLMRLKGETTDIKAGQFVNIKLDGYFLRRPISVCDINGDELTIIYKIVGAGTRAMSGYAPKKTLDVLTGLGNGYDLSVCGDRPLLIGGGAGVPPMYLAAKTLKEMGADVTAILGFNASDEVFFKEEFENLGVNTIITTADGSMGKKGFVTDAMDGLDYSYFYACGPQPMLKAVYDASSTQGQLSFEERMGCGFGACMGCTCETKYGAKRICKDGPVLKKEEVIW